jgi:nitrogen fixation protein FixH
VRLTDRDGSPLHGASVAASAERPLGAPQTRPLAFHEIAAGSYIADVTLPTPGQWELTLTASLGGHDMAATRRVIVH